MRFVKPLDRVLIAELAETHRLLITLEENALAGGAGSAVGELLAELGLVMPLLLLGLPDRYVGQGSHGEQLRECGLDAEGIGAAIRQRLESLEPP
jgi:1-deoxy-D-xylulose-5-phosphate synthase